MHCLQIVSNFFLGVHDQAFLLAVRAEITFF